VSDPIVIARSRHPDHASSRRRHTHLLEALRHRTRLHCLLHGLRFDICGEIDEPVAPNDYGVRELLIPGGRCAVVRHAGSTDHIGETIYPIYRDWLPASGEELRDQPLVFHYLSVYPDTPQDQWQTDIYIPLV
jgi:DNA gyrase inhibitor GyrI